MKHLNIRVYGRVQGVFFRSHTYDEAERLGLVGFVRNEADGSVYIEAEGEQEVLDQFVLWCQQGPTIAHVDNVEMSEGGLVNFQSFDIQ